MNESIDMKKLSPMMQQYMEIKNQHKNHLLFFRLGDFYELFFEDAIVASKELEITLTGKECGLAERAPMCGIPYHSVDTYIKKLISKGFKIAICEQTDKMDLKKGIVKRDVVRIITPGTISESSMLEDGINNYICSVFLKGNDFGICFADISTGAVHVTQVNSENVTLSLINEFERFMPSEILYNNDVANLKEVSKYLAKRLKCIGELLDDNKYNINEFEKIINGQFSKIPKDIIHSNFCIYSLGALVSYLKDTQKEGAKRLVDLRYYNDCQYMGLDAAVRRNLELTQTMRTGQKRGSLLWVLDKTKTAMGKRLIRKLIEQPLINPIQIKRRHDAVEALTQKPALRDDIFDVLSKIYDLERLMTKVIYGSINPREFKSLSYTIGELPQLKEYLNMINDPLIQSINKNINDMTDIHELLESVLVEEPPVTIKEGGVICKGFNKELDELRNIRENGKDMLLQIEAQERERTGISKLRINYNRVFGYYIEITKSFLDKVPDNYIRKQTLTSSERFITQELKEYEEKILTASERSITIEQDIFEEMRRFVAERLIIIQSTAEAVSMVDVLCSFSLVAQQNRYTKPQITTDGEIIIKEGKHPVVEAVIDLPFVPNDTTINVADNKMMVITGPNMAGKSTYMRQVALIVLMAQIGSFVPAEFAKIGIVDKIFTRVGASDDLTAGQSTFMVEMSEVAKILKNATSNSLIILDEIGRGTSTFDGMSIAKAVAEYIINSKGLGSKTLFATHYHELTSLEQELNGVVNYNIAVKKRGDDITFLRKIVKGGVDDSYGIAVAKLAGIPDSVIKRANVILKELESEKVGYIKNEQSKTDENLDQIPLLSSGDEKVIKKLKDLSLDTLTPIEAMNVLYNLKQDLG